MLSFFKEFFYFLKERKKYWLFPIIIVLAIFGASYPVQWGPWNNSSNQQLFLNIDGIQMNGRHCMVSMMNHDIFYEGSVQKSKGMVLIDYDRVRSALDSFL